MIIWQEEPFGTCPVQATGWINDRPFYFRSRYSHSCLEIANKPDTNRDPKTVISADDAITYELKEYNDQYVAGYITKDEAKELIIQFANRITNQSCK